MGKGTGKGGRVYMGNPIFRPFRFVGAFVVFRVEDAFNFLAGKGQVARNNKFLNGPYAPVGEAGPEPPLEVIGEIPACLDGLYVRNGPNVQMEVKGGYHLFDGDGMLHGVKMKGGKATYTARFVETKRFQIEKHWRRPVYMKIGDLTGLSALFYILTHKIKSLMGVVHGDMAGTGNTAVEFHDGRLLALHEADHPYVSRVLCDGVMETVDRLTYDKALSKTPFTAHPKVDPVSGEMVAFGYKIDSKPYLSVYVITPDSKLKGKVDLGTPAPAMMHDGQITQKYAVVLWVPLVFNPQEGMKEGGSPFLFKKDMGAKVGLLPRDPARFTAENVQWFDLPGCMCFHTTAAWDEGDEVVMHLTRYEDFSFEYLQKAAANKDGGFQDSSYERPQNYEFRLNTKTGAASQKLLCPFKGVEFPRIHPSLVSLPTRYAYMITFGDVDKVEGCLKVDLVSGKEVGHAKLGEGRAGGEFVFVPKKQGRPAPGEEDDGYLVTYVMDEARGNKSELIVLDAKTMSSTPVARVLLNHRIPPGFHGMHVPEAKLKAQKSALP